MAALKAASLALEGLLKPLILRTNWIEAARISSSVTGGSKLKRILIFLHIAIFSALAAWQASSNYFIDDRVCGAKAHDEPARQMTTQPAADCGPCDKPEPARARDPIH